jgi:hypothetical protein
MKATKLIRQSANKHDGMYHACEVEIIETDERNYKEFHLSYKKHPTQNSVYIRLNTDECKLLARKLYRDIHKAAKLDDARVMNAILKPYHSPADYQPEIAVIKKNTKVVFQDELTFQSKMNYEEYDM